MSLSQKTTDVLKLKKDPEGEAWRLLRTAEFSIVDYLLVRGAQPAIRLRGLIGPNAKLLEISGMATHPDEPLQINLAYKLDGVYYSRAGAVAEIAKDILSGVIEVYAFHTRIVGAAA